MLLIRMSTFKNIWLMWVGFLSVSFVVSPGGIWSLENKHRYKHSSVLQPYESNDETLVLFLFGWSSFIFNLKTARNSTRRSNFVTYGGVAKGFVISPYRAQWTRLLLANTASVLCLPWVWHYRRLRRVCGACSRAAVTLLWHSASPVLVCISRVSGESS